jgi:hypothetical protein
MSLEKAIEALTVAVAHNSSLLEKMMAGAASKAVAAATMTAAQAEAVTKPAAAAAKPAAAKAAKAPKAPTEEDLRNSFGGYLSVKDKADREERKENVGKILAHFGVAKATEIAEENRAEAIKAVQTLEAGDTPDFFEAEEAGEDEADDSLI